MDKKISRKLLCIAMVFFWASEYCHAPYFTPYLYSLGFAASAIGFMTGAYGFTQLFARIPIGMATDAFSCYKTTILLGTIATTVSSFFLMFVRSEWAIIVCRVVAGLAASTWLAFTVLYNAYYKDDESVRAMTNVNAFSNGGKLLAFFLGIATASFFGYRIPLLCSFLTGCVSIVAVALMKPISLKHESFSFRHIVHVIRTPRILVVSFFAIMMQFFMQGTVFSFTSGRAEGMGTSSFTIGVISLAFTCVQLLVAPFVGKKMLCYISEQIALLLGFFLLSVSSLTIAFAPWVWLLVLANVLAGTGNIIINGLLMANVVRSVPEEKRSTAMGLFQAIYSIGMTLGPVMVGRFVNSRGYTDSYIFVSILMAATALLVLPLMKLSEKKN